MADDDGNVPNKPSKSYNRPQQPETFHRTQETQVEHKFPNRSTGIIPLPPGSRGPRSLYLKRHGDSFGFTLRHFIVYPPDSVTEDDGRHAAVGALSTPMDTIFVKHIKERGPAKQAGLQRGDRLVAVNGIPVTDKSYSQVVQLIQNSPDYLHLLVVPKEEDILQRYFSETAYNPATNQNLTNDKQQAQNFLTQTFNQCPIEFQVDTVSWNSLKNPYNLNSFDLYDNHFKKEKFNEIYTEIPTNDDKKTKQQQQQFIQIIKAQPQVPIYKKMGRRASDGCTLSTNDYYTPATTTTEFSSLNSDLNKMVVNNNNNNNNNNTNNNNNNNNNPNNNNNKNYISSQNPNMLNNYPNKAGCRLSLDASCRRESSSSLTSTISTTASSLIDKDSLFDSTSTLTGHETDDSAIMTRYRKSFQQKEEFLKMPPTNDSSLIQKEFYGRPKKLEKSMWPPLSPPIIQDVKLNTNNKPIHQNFQRVKNDIDTERDLLKLYGKRENLDEIQEASVAPNASLDTDDSDISDTDSKGKRTYLPNHQIVHKRTKEFESGKPLPEDDPILSNRTSFYRSELARLSSKRVVPNVTERAQEYEIRSIESASPPLKRDQTISESSTNSSIKKIHANSLDSSGSNASRGSINEILNNNHNLNKKLSGNVIISSGSKFIHCPPPSEYGKPTDLSENEAIKIRARSNSAESWVAALQQNDTKSQDTSDVTKGENVNIPLIPEPVERMQITSPSTTPPIVSVTFVPSLSRALKVPRPTQLDLDGPIKQHLKLPKQRSVPSVIGDDKPIVVKRRTKNTNLAEDERTMRRESYLKATEGGRMPFDNDLSDGDISPRILRSAHRRWRPPLFPGDIQQLRKLFEDTASSLGGSISGNSSSSASLERDKLLLDKEKDNIIIKEGALHCKITEIDGKRFGDRSWKQIWAILRGPKLFLYKDRHHQSPIGSADAVEHSLANGVDMRASCVRVAEDYTKRKNVLRLSSVNPCRSEFLLQADNTDDLVDWVKVLQEQMATTTDVEDKFDPLSSKQQAVPQTNPATTSIQIQGSTRLLPQQQTTNKSLIRNRSPTGQSPVSKTRKPSQQQIFVEQQLNTSPKSKTWRGRVVKQFRKMQGVNSQPNSPTQSQMQHNQQQQFDGSTFGITLDQCIPSLTSPYVPRFVEICTNIVDAKGLHTIGIYRVPGNNASITQLTEEINRNYDYVPIDDPKWNDLHVVSSLLKSYFRKMPDSLITNHLYPYFIQADKCDNPQLRMKKLKKLIKNLPPHNYHTLKHLVLHLKRVIDNSDINKMEAKNLAIVFGPTIVRPEEENMESMVNNMTHQCKIVETLLTCADWFFNDDDDIDDNCDLTVLGAGSNANATAADLHDDLETGNNQALLLDNISKYEALKEKEKNGALFSSIISAAQRKVKRKATKGACSLSNDTKDENSSYNNGIGSYPRPFSLTDLKDSTTTENKTNIIPTTVTDMEKNKQKQQKQTEKVPWFNYSTDQEDFHRRIENFELETRAMLQMPRNLEISVTNIVPKSVGNLSCSTSNVNNQNSRLTTKPSDLLKTHSASNVFSRQLNLENNNSNNNNRNSLDNSSFKTVQYQTTTTTSKSKFDELQLNDSNKNIIENKGAFSDNNRNLRFSLRRGSSVENINTSSIDLNTNGTMKKIKYENEADVNIRSGSLDSLNKIPSTDDDTDLVTSLTKLYDKKLKEKSQSSLLTTLENDDIPYVDESPEKLTIKNKQSDKENIPLSELLYRNPSLHKNQSKEHKKGELEKDEDSTEKLMKTKLIINNNKIGSKLKRSESLNKPERSPLNNSKLKRSESLNKADKLTKMEKTDLNLNKRRITKEIKLKRKNGMPDRSIKRRHTVGGTKDPDKLTWLDNKQPKTINNSNKEKNLRTSSPDLSSTRKEKLFLEINLIGPENMVMALKQHLIGARPQSFPESNATVFKVPLESHV